MTSPFWFPLENDYTLWEKRNVGWVWSYLLFWLKRL